MFELINPLVIGFQLDFLKYVFIAFAFFGVVMLVRKIILNKGV